MTVSGAALAAINAEHTDEAFLALLTINHVELASPIRVVNDGKELVSRGETFVPYPFDLTLPDARSDSLPRARLIIGNVHRDVVGAIRALTEPAEVTVEVVLASSPDTVEVSLPRFRIENITFDALTIEGELSLRHLADEPYPAGRYTPTAFPGLFA